MQLPPDTLRLKFRPFADEDAGPLFAVLDDPYSQRFYPDMSPELAQAWVRRNLERYEQDGFGLWVVELIETGEMIGVCGLTMQPVNEGRELEVGYHIHAGHRRQGYATEAATACLRFGFEITQAPRIVSLVHKKNVASQGVAESIHQEREETIRRGMPHWVYFTRREQCKP